MTTQTQTDSQGNSLIIIPSEAILELMCYAMVVADFCPNSEGMSFKGDYVSGEIDKEGDKGHIIYTGSQNTPPWELFYLMNGEAGCLDVKGTQDEEYCWDAAGLCTFQVNLDDNDEDTTTFVKQSYNIGQKYTLGGGRCQWDYYDEKNNIYTSGVMDSYSGKGNLIEYTNNKDIEHKTKYSLKWFDVTNTEKLI